MGSVTSTLERMVIDVAWTFHEWFYGGAPGTATCNHPRPARRKRHLTSSRSGVRRTVSAAAALRCANLPGPGGYMDSDDDKMSSLFSRDVYITSTPVLDRRRRAARQQRRPADLASTCTDSGEGEELRPALQATLFRCTAARNGSLPSWSPAAMNAASAAGLRGLYSKRQALGHRRCASATAGAGLSPVLPPLLPTYQRVACLRV